MYQSLPAQPSPMLCSLQPPEQLGAFAWHRVILSPAPAPRKQAQDLRPAPCRPNKACTEPEREKEGRSACNWGKPSVLLPQTGRRELSPLPASPFHLQKLLNLPRDQAQCPHPLSSQPAPSPHCTTLPHLHPDTQTTAGGFPRLSKHLLSQTRPQGPT